MPERMKNMLNKNVEEVSANLEEFCKPVKNWRLSFVTRSTRTIWKDRACAWNCTPDKIVCYINIFVINILNKKYTPDKNVNYVASMIINVEALSFWKQS